MVKLKIIQVCFNPLAGVSCNAITIKGDLVDDCFNPLAGVSCNLPVLMLKSLAIGFNPLAGVSCNYKHTIQTVIYPVSIPLRV